LQAKSPGWGKGAPNRVFGEISKLEKQLVSREKFLVVKREPGKRPPNLSKGGLLLNVGGAWKLGRTQPQEVQRGKRTSDGN